MFIFSFHCLDGTDLTRIVCLFSNITFLFTFSESLRNTHSCLRAIISCGPQSVLDKILHWSIEFFKLSPIYANTPVELSVTDQNRGTFMQDAGPIVHGSKVPINRWVKSESRQGCPLRKARPWKGRRFISTSPPSNIFHVLNRLRSSGLFGQVVSLINGTDINYIKCYNWRS